MNNVLAVNKLVNLTGAELKVENFILKPEFRTAEQPNSFGKFEEQLLCFRTISEKIFLDESKKSYTLKLKNIPKPQDGVIYVISRDQQRLFFADKRNDFIVFDKENDEEIDWRQLAVEKQLVKLEGSFGIITKVAGQLLFLKVGIMLIEEKEEEVKAKTEMEEAFDKAASEEKKGNKNSKKKGNKK